MILPNGQETKTTFWEDFSIADAFGDNAIKGTYKRAFEEWKNDIEYLTELVIILNLKCWYWYERGNESRSRLYSNLYYEADGRVYGIFSGDEEKLSYYFNMTD